MRVRLLSLWAEGVLLDDEEYDEEERRRFIVEIFLLVSRDDEVEALATEGLLFVRRLPRLLELEREDEERLFDESEADEEVDGDRFRLFRGAACFSTAFFPTSCLCDSRFAKIESAVPFLE